MSQLRTTVYWVLADVSEKNAGYRLRILPLTEKMIALGVDISVISEQELAKQIKTIAEEAQTVISSKPANTTVFLCLKYLAQHNVNVIVDLFDNYFSWSPTIYQHGVYWNWLRVMQTAAKVFVSTPFLQHTLEQLSTPNIGLIPDPLPVSLNDLPTFFAENSKWHGLSRIEFLWFGINSNPYYKAGLEDLVSWRKAVRKICLRLEQRYETRITICTKRVPEVETALNVFRQDGINARFVEWSEEACDEELKNSHIVLIPTNLSGFSLSKTHNRCSDALTRACLVMASPNGPYHNVPGGVFSSIDALCDLMLSEDKAEIQQRIGQSLEFIKQDSENDLPKQLSSEKSDEYSLTLMQQALPLERPVFVVSQTKLDTVKLSRILGYLVASFKGSGVAANYDIFIEAIDADNSSIFLTLSEAAFNYFTASIIRNVDLEWSGSQDNLLWSKDGWSFRFNHQALSCVVKTEEISQNLLRLAIFAKMNGQQPYHEGLLYAENVKLLCLILKRLGVKKMEFAGDGCYGWHEFAQIADADLNASAQKLNNLWCEYQSNEICLGRPALRSACAE